MLLSFLLEQFVADYRAYRAADYESHDDSLYDPSPAAPVAGFIVASSKKPHMASIAVLPKEKLFNGILWAGVSCPHAKTLTKSDT